jgi:hypothetical protein
LPAPEGYFQCYGASVRDVDYRYLLCEGIWLALAFLVLESADMGREYGVLALRHAKLWFKCRREQLRAGRS